MTIRIVAGLVAALAAGSAGAEPADDPMTAPRAFVAGLDAGKIDDAAATMTPDASMLDEFPPYAWSGADAFKRWLSDFEAANKAGHVTGGKVKLGDPIVSQVTGEVAYVVAPATETFKQNGVRMAETARMVFALRREGGTWKIASWAWAGRKPHPAAKAS